MERIRVGIVGASMARSWATVAHLPALSRLEEFEVTAVATTRQASAKQTADAFEVPNAFADAGELVSHPAVDLVVVSVKAPDHAKVIQAAASAGKHVLSEWPLGVDLAQAADLAGTVAETGVVHAVALQGYHSPGARFVKELLDEGRIGQVESVSVVAGGDPLGGSRISRDYAWSTDPAAGNTVLTVMVGHTMAVLDHLVGIPAEVSAVVANRHDQVAIVESGESIANGAPGQVALLGRLHDGAVTSVTIHGGSAPGPDGFLIKIAGTEGTLAITPAEPAHYMGWADWRIRARAADGTATDLTVPDQYRTVPADFPAGPAANIAAVYREIGRAIAEGRQPHPDFHTAVRHHRLLDAVERASRTGRRQEVTA